MTAVAMTQADEITESLDQWVKFCATLPSESRGEEIIQTPGCVLASCRTVWPMGNLAVFTTPVESAADLAHRIETLTAI